MSDALPLVSVTMPTYKRLAMLRRAVDSVQAQTFADWELIIGDDEEPTGETWAYLQELAAAEPRVRIFRSPLPHGQISNNNFCMQQARGTWIKPLFDDDTLKPNCLSRFIEAVQRAPRAVMVHCLSDRYVHDVLQPSPRRGRRGRLELIEQEKVHLAMYVQDVELQIPTQVMVHRRVIDAGVLWEKLPEVYSGNDTWWYARLLQHGDLLLINEPLVDQYWGHETGTTFVQNNPPLFDRELIVLRERYGSLIPPHVCRPPLEHIRGQVHLMRGLLRLRDRRWGEALGKMFSTASPAAWRLSFHWLLRQYVPGAAQLVPRRVLEQ